MSLIERLEYIDDFLSKMEDYLHGEDGKECTKCRHMIVDFIRQTDLIKAVKVQPKLDSAIGKRVRWHPVDIEETFDGTIIEEKEFLYVVVPDDDYAPRSNWNKITCEIIGDS